MRSPSRGQIGRAAANLGIGVVGLVIVRLMVQGMPMFHDAGWIVQGKLSVVAAVVILVDALLLSLLVGFAIQVRSYLLNLIAAIPALGTMAVSLVLLICSGLAYTDFKPLTTAWPSIKKLYVWTFFVIAALLLVQITVLLFQNRDRIAALVLGQPIPALPRKDSSSQVEEGRTMLAAR